jgi:nucleolar protein 14
MAPEDKMLERYTRAQLKGKASAFDLEDDETGELTHMGKSLSLNGPKIQDDFEEEDLELSDADEERPILKRRRSDMEGAEEDNHEGADEGADDEDLPERKKSKQEVMKELIAKSKLHKYERQAAKDDDDDLREELDKEMPNIHALLRGIGPKAPSAPVAEIPGMNPGRLALLHGTEKAKIEKDYDIQLRQLAQDQRSKPTEKSKTEEQIIEERARKLQDLEAKRLRRMQGAPESSDEEDVKDRPSEEDEEDEFGLGAGIKARPTMVELGIDDEDDFLIDDGLVASGSEMYDSDVESSDGGKALEEEEEDEFVKGILTKEEAGRPEFLTGANGPVQEVEDLAKNGINGNLAYSFECPQSHEELLQVMKKVAILDLPTAIQRIRTIHSPNLRSESKAKLAKFAVALVDHISYLANQEKPPPFAVLEAVIRHIHSLAKTYAVEVANAFRRQLKDIHKTRSLAFTPGDLVIFTAIGNIFPTSDHFHQVVTPAILTMARYLGLKIPQSLSDYAIGTYLCALCIQYQRLSKRYVPEAMSFIENTLCVLAPKKFGRIPGNFPFHEPKTAMQITSAPNSTRKLTFYDCVYMEGSAEEQLELKIAIMEADIKLLGAAVDLWTGLSAYAEIFDPVLKIVKHLSGKGCRAMLPESTKVSFRISSICKLELRNSKC